MQVDQWKIGGIAVAMIIGVGLVASGAMAAGISPVDDISAPPSDDGASAEPSYQEVDGQHNISVGDESADGATTYTVTNDADEVKRASVTVTTEASTVRTDHFSLDSGDTVSISFTESANYTLSVDIVDGVSETYDITVDCNLRQTQLLITSEGSIEVGEGGQTLVACGAVSAN